MPIAKVTSKGQITVPVSVRRALGVESGDFLAFEVGADYATVRRQDSLEQTSVKVRGLIGGRTPVYGDDDEAVLSAFDDVEAASTGDELLLISVAEKDLA